MSITSELNDSLDDIFGAPSGDVRVEPVRAPADYKAPDYSEPCPKCRGTGRFTGYSGRTVGQCFTCKGTARIMFKTSPETRAKAKASANARKDRIEQESLDAFKASNPAVAAWIEAEHLRFAFAANMRAAILRFGYLTENQLAACQRCIDRNVAKVAARAEAIQNAPQVDTAGIDRLKAAFDKAIAYTAAKGKGLKLRSPKITIGGLTISPAKATSANPGALYVKSGQDYLGKIVGGKLMAVPMCTPAQREQILKFVADPAEAAKVYGQETGVCCVCNATLKSAWRLRGIGPICAEKMGWDGE